MFTNSKISNVITWSSLIFLAAFLLNWNIKEYQKEVDLLKKNLNTQFELAQSDIRDSVFTKILEVYEIESFVNFPNSKDSSSASIDKFIFDNSINVINKDSGKTLISDSVSTFNFAAIIQSDSIIPTFENFNQPISEISFDFNLAKDSFNGVTAFKSAHFDVNNQDTINTFSFQSLNDSTITFRQFEKRLKQAGLIDKFIITYGESDSLIDANLKISFTKDIINSKNDFVVSNFRGYILKKIWPSILMSSLLFLLVALGFYLLNKSRRQQESISLLKNEFVSNMTHELKTPISTISVALESLTNYGTINDPVKATEYINISKHELNRLHILVDKVLKMSRFEDSGMKLEKQHVDVHLLVEQILVSMQLHFEKHQVKHEYSILGESHNVLADKVHLTNVIYNIIDNAIKYSKGKPEIFVRIKEMKSEVVIEVEDNGIGIDKTYKDKIFDRFFRVPQNNTHNTKGYGLGLNYVKEVVKKHEGRVEVDSTINVGTAIRLIFPKVMTK